MKRRLAIFTLSLLLSGCGDDDDDAAEAKTPMPLDQVSPAVLQAAQKFAPELTFYAAYKDKFEGQDSIELKGKSKNGKIKEIEVSPDGKVLGSE